MNYTKKVAEFVSQTRFESIPPSALEETKRALLDCIGVMLAGSKEESARICAKLAKEESSSQGSTVIGQGFKSSTLMAAFSNGTAGHALDFDHGFIMGQPSAGVIPAILALGEKVGASGRDILVAYVVGFEVIAKLCRSMPGHNPGGWHATATLGSLGTAVACARILALNPQGIQHTLGIASSMASGLRANFATMTKPLHAGLAAKNGVLAAQLASSGFDANPTVVGDNEGFSLAFSRDIPSDLHPLEELGSSFDLVTRGIRFKPYPCGGLTHPAVEAILKIREQQNISPEDVESIKVKVTPSVFHTILNRLPETALQTKFSMPYILARALIDGKLGLETFSLEAAQDPSVRRLGAKVEMEFDPDLPENEDASRPCRVILHQKDGKTLSESVGLDPATQRPRLSSQELRMKFTDCASRVISSKAAAEVEKHIDHLEQLDSLDPLFKLLIAA